MPITSEGSSGPTHPIVDQRLGEKLIPYEAALTTQLADTIEKGIRAQYKAGNARRDVHSKATGLLKAEFRINDAIPRDLAKGVFMPGRTYQAWIRFSNGSGNPSQSDDNEDGRGMAIKLLGVPGEKILENDRDATTQDFVMINHPIFITNDPRTYLTLVQKAGSSNLLTKLSIPLTLGLKGTLIAKEVNKGKITNPLQIRYFSATPFQHGVGSDRQVVKYSVRPNSEAVDPMPDNPGHDYLREAMLATLREGDVTMTFAIQPKTSGTMNVEDSTVEWDEAQAPFYDAATIHIPKQNFDTPEQNQLGENLSFDPWHALPEHRPLGSLNRMRRVVYERISRVRREMNSIETTEPSF